MRAAGAGFDPVFVAPVDADGLAAAPDERSLPPSAAGRRAGSVAGVFLPEGAACVGAAFFAGAGVATRVGLDDGTVLADAFFNTGSAFFATGAGFFAGALDGAGAAFFAGALAGAFDAFVAGAAGFFAGAGFLAAGLAADFAGAGFFAAGLAAFFAAGAAFFAVFFDATSACSFFP